MLNTSLPAGTVDLTVLYAEEWNRYRVLNTQAAPFPDFAPGQDQITLSSISPLPGEALGGVIEYSGHLMPATYEPFDYLPDNPLTYQLRPFIPGDKVIRLNRLSPAVALWTRYTRSGALRLCVAYQSDRKVQMGTYTQDGNITLPVPLPDSTDRYYLDYRLLTSVTGPTEPNPPKPGLTVRTTYTTGIPYQGKVVRISFYEPDPIPARPRPADLGGRQVRVPQSAGD